MNFNTKKTVVSAFITTFIATSCVFANDTKTQQELKNTTNEDALIQEQVQVILINKVKVLEKKVQKLEAKVYKLEHATEGSNLQLLSQETSPNTVTSSSQELAAATRGMKIEKGKKYKIDNLYQVVKTTYGYRDKYLRRKSSIVYTPGNFVIATAKTKRAIKTTSGVWVNKRDLKKIRQIKNITKKGGFFAVNTYMANIRKGPDVSYEVSEVLRKNDVLVITEAVKNKDGGVWGKTLNENYINLRILRKLPYLK